MNKEEAKGGKRNQQRITAYYRVMSTARRSSHICMYVYYLSAHCGAFQLRHQAPFPIPVYARTLSMDD